MSCNVQRPAKRFVNLAKQDPGRARQNSVATARRNFSQLRTSLLADLCMSLGIGIDQSLSLIVGDPSNQPSCLLDLDLKGATRIPKPKEKSSAPFSYRDISLTELTYPKEATGVNISLNWTFL